MNCHLLFNQYSHTIYQYNHFYSTATTLTYHNRVIDSGMIQLSMGEMNRTFQYIHPQTILGIVSSLWLGQRMDFVIIGLQVHRFLFVINVRLSCISPDYGHRNIFCNQLSGNQHKKSYSIKST